MFLTSTPYLYKLTLILFLLNIYKNLIYVCYNLLVEIYKELIYVTVKYITKKELNKMLEIHFTRFNTFKDMLADNLEQFGYNIPVVLINDNEFYYIIECSIINENFETYKKEYNIFKQYKNNYIIGGYFDSFNNTLYCTDTNYINSNDNVMAFINYVEDYN